MHYAHAETSGQVLFLIYECKSCHIFHRVFVVKVSENSDYILKVGQYPEIDISIDKDFEIALGESSKLFRKGLVCEAQGYGIGAYAYYRRIVESIIDDLLNDIYDLVSDEDKKQYKLALDEIKKTNQASDKIALVKDHLPYHLRINGVNPLGTLYQNLSEGLHSKTDNECINLAQEIRIVLVYLIKQVVRTKNDKKEFTESQKRLLNKKIKTP
jgi:tetratricopeptide (TPR) repeat protein